MSNLINFFGLTAGSVDGIAGVPPAYSDWQDHQQSAAYKAAYYAAYTNALAAEYSLVPGVGAVFASQAINYDVQAIFAKQQEGIPVGASDYVSLLTNITTMAFQGVGLLGGGEAVIVMTQPNLHRLSG